MTKQANSEKQPAAQELSYDACQRLADDRILQLARQAMAKVVAESREAVVRQQALGEIPSPHISALAHALADTDGALAEGQIAELLRSGVGVRDLCLDHLTPAARELGALWERDAMPFADVTMAMARIQSILRNMSARSPAARRAVEAPPNTGAIFAAVPGEAHTLGVLMAADHFRRNGWDVALWIGMEQGELSQKIAKDDRKVIVLSCAGRHSAPALHQLIAEIRQRRPEMEIALSGNVLNDREVMQSLPPVDGVIDGLATAEDVLRPLLEATCLEA